MDKQSETGSLEHCLEVQLTRIIHQLRHGTTAQQSLEQSVQSLSTLYDTEAIQAACERLSQRLPPAIADTKAQLQELRAFAASSALAATTTPQDSTSHLNFLSERAGLLWCLNDLSNAATDFNRLLDTSTSSHHERTSVQWQINNLLAMLALDNNDLLQSRSMTMQAMFCARGLEDVEKIERSEFSLACTLSKADNSTKLKDNFVVLRSGVLGRQSHLPIYQQHLVLLFSARDFCRRNMRASAQWILDTAEEFVAQMLPAELAVFHQVKSQFFDLNGQKQDANDALSKAEGLSVNKLFPEACISEKEQQLELFLEQYNAVSAALK